MMRGNNWQGNYACSSFMGSNIFAGWHYMIMFAIIIIIVALIVWDRRKDNGNENSAMSSLQELYVTGEITEEEYLKRKNVIGRK